MEDIKKQRYYIYENINQLKNHNQIIDLISIHDCKFTENDNGIFLNLNTTEDKVITMIYHSMLNNINYKEEIYDNIINDSLSDIIENNTPGEIIPLEKISNDNLSFKNFSKKDREIIEYSKKYNL
jgi:hypothetical protein